MKKYLTKKAHCVILVLSTGDYEAQGRKPVEMATYFERGSEQSLKPTGKVPTVYQVAETEKTILFVARDWVGVCVVSTIIERGCRSLGGIIGSVM